MKDFYQEFKEFLSTKFSPLIWLSEKLVSPHIVRLPKSLEFKFKSVIRAFKKLGESKAYQDFILKDKASSCVLFSPLMSFDFHITSQNKPKLIEINTNPAFVTGSALLVDFYREKKGLEGLSGTKIKDKLLQSFEALFPSEKPIECLVILDEAPDRQNFFFEFQCMKDWFSKRWKSEVLIMDPKAFYASNKKVDLVYNRLTDFFLLQHPEILKAWREKEFLLFPNPFLYSLFSDKTRLADWWRRDLRAEFGLSKSENKAMKSVLVESFLLQEQSDKMKIWDERKKYFFKPLHSFGGKASYRGRSISKKKFQSLLHEDILVQEEIPPSVFKEELKYDVRCYALGGECEMTVARLYQGQVTNFQSPNGGFAPIQWVEE